MCRYIRFSESVCWIYFEFFLNNFNSDKLKSTYIYHSTNPNPKQKPKFQFQCASMRSMPNPDLFTKRNSGRVLKIQIHHRPLFPPETLDEPQLRKQIFNSQKPNNTQKAPNRPKIARRLNHDRVELPKPTREPPSHNFSAGEDGKECRDSMRCFGEPPLSLSTSC